MTKVYGYSDDLIEVENINGKYYNKETDTHLDELYLNGKYRQIRFDDGTTIRIGYGKPEGAIWWIKVTKKGTATFTLTECDNEDAEIYSDIFEIDAYPIIKRN